MQMEKKKSSRSNKGTFVPSLMKNNFEPSRTQAIPREPALIVSNVEDYVVESKMLGNQGSSQKMTEEADKKTEGGKQGSSL